jgi:hypothetical protein
MESQNCTANPVEEVAAVTPAAEEAVNSAPEPAKGRITITMTLNDPELIEANPGETVKSFDCDGVLIFGQTFNDEEQRVVSNTDCVGRISHPAIAECLLSMPFGKRVIAHAAMMDMMGKSSRNDPIADLLEKLRGET